MRARAHNGVVTMHLLLFAAAAALASSHLAPRAHAQQAERDTLPFRKGQWGVEFPVHSDIGLGFLYFLTRRSAILVDARIKLERSFTTTKGLLTPAHASEQKEETAVRLGLRTYRPIGPKVAALAAFGVAPGWSRLTRLDDYSEFTSERTSVGRSYGAFAEVGAVYFPASKVSLGMFTGLSGSLTRSRDRTQSTSEYANRSYNSRGHQIDVLKTTIIASLYF